MSLFVTLSFTEIIPGGVGTNVRNIVTGAVPALPSGGSFRKFTAKRIGGDAATVAGSVHAVDGGAPAADQAGALVAQFTPAGPNADPIIPDVFISDDVAFTTFDGVGGFEVVLTAAGGTIDTGYACTLVLEAGVGAPVILLP